MPLVHTIPTSIISVYPLVVYTGNVFITSNCHNPNNNTTQHNLNTVVGLDMKIQTYPPTTETQLASD